LQLTNCGREKLQHDTFPSRLRASHEMDSRTVVVRL